MAIRNGGLPPKFKNVMLAAPDVDVDVFRSQIEDMGKRQPRWLHIVRIPRMYRALAFSRRVWGDIPRLGSIDPGGSATTRTRWKPMRSPSSSLTKKAKAGDGLHHSKFAESPQVVQLIGARISEGQTLTDSRMGLGDHLIAGTTGAAAAAGNAAGLILAAPMAAVDPHTRDNYAHHVSGMAGHIGAEQKIAVNDCTSKQAAARDPACRAVQN